MKCTGYGRYKQCPQHCSHESYWLVEEGIFRNHMPATQGGRRNSIVLSILKAERGGNIKELLQTTIH